MEIDDRSQQLQEADDRFLTFVEYARAVLNPGEPKEANEEEEDDDGGGEGSSGPGWRWIASRLLKTCIAYSSGVTPAILLSELSQAWGDQQRARAPRRRPEIINQLKKKNRRNRLPNTVTIDSIYDKSFLSLSSVLEAVIVDAFLLPGTEIYMLRLGDFWSSNTIDLYLHRRYYDLVDPRAGILKKGREVFLTGCYLRGAREGSGCPRLLPTEYLVILLDDEQDDDAMLIAAQFCSDSFSSISLSEASSGVLYSLYARIESIGPVEAPGKFNSVQRRQITLVDNDGIKLKFLLWGEQVILANLCSIGSMLALDSPYIGSCTMSAAETTDELCLEYGSATQLYLVPFIQHEEQVCVQLSQNRFQGSKLMSALEPTQGLKVSQVKLPCDSHGSIDFSNYPFRTFVADLRHKMSSISLYGIVADIFHHKRTSDVVFSLKIEDLTGTVCAKLHFTESWSLGRVGIGHTIFISGLSCSVTRHGSYELSWFENDGGASLVNLSCLPAFLNSSCLCKLSSLHDLLHDTSCQQVCHVKLDQVDQWHVNTRLTHSLCGHAVNPMPNGDVRCSFCHCTCNTEAVVRTFHLIIVIADGTANIYAWSVGQTAAELLQISPDEFYHLSEDEQFMYPSSLESESFIVALVNCRRLGDKLSQCLATNTDAISWEITRAQRCDL